MNTRASVAYGWGILCLAGGGSYYFAKRSINADRSERAAAIEEQRRQRRERLRAAEMLTHEDDSKARRRGNAPNADKPHDADPEVEHAPQQQSKYEPKEPWRSRKGDRFS